MAVKIESRKEARHEVVSYSKKEDYKAIVLKKDGKTYVEHVTLADNLIKSKKATEAKDVNFEVEALTIKFIEEVAVKSK